MANARRIEKKDKFMNYQCLGTDEDICGDTIYGECVVCGDGYCEKHIDKDDVCVNCQED